MNKKKHVEHSKIITTGVLILSAIVVVFTIFMIWRTEDLSPLAYLIPSIEIAFGLTAKHYYAKAALENQIKLRKKYGKDAADAVDAMSNEDNFEE